MNLNIFVHFPQDENTIFEIIKDEHSFQNFIKEVVNIINKSKKENNTHLFYDAENIKLFFDTCKEWNNATYLESATTKLRHKLGLTANQIDTYSLRETDCSYFIWNINNSITFDVPIVLQEAAEHFWKEEKTLILNFKENIATDRHYIIVFKDATHKENFPQNFARLPFVCDLDNLDLWLITNNKSGFSLLNKNRFKRTSQVQQGQTVFEELKTGYFWYLDNFHKSHHRHYEVFNSVRHHIGEADLEGNIDYSKAKSDRTF